MEPEQRQVLLKEWIVLTLNVAFLGLIGLYLPLFFTFSGLLLPIPLTILVYRQNLRAGVLSLLAATLILFILLKNPLMLLSVMIQFGPLGLLYGLLFKNHVSVSKSIISGSLGASALIMLALYLSFGVTGVSPFATASREINAAVNETIGFYKDADLGASLDQEELRTFIENAARTIILLLPGGLVLGAIISSVITYFLSRLVMQKLGCPVPELRPFNSLRFPWYSIWGLIISLILSLSGDQFGLSLMSVIGKNLLFIFAFVFFFLGLSVVTYYFQKSSLPKLLKLVLIFIIVFYLPVAFFAALMIILIGIFDPFINWRRFPVEKG